MSPRVVLALAVTGGLLVGGAGGVWWKVSQRLARVEREEGQWPLVQVLVAGHALPVGHVVTPEDLGLRRSPQRRVTAATLKPGAFDESIGAVLAVPVAAGQPLEPGFFESHREQRLEREACVAAVRGAK